MRLWRFLIFALALSLFSLEAAFAAQSTASLDALIHQQAAVESEESVLSADAAVLSRDVAAEEKELAKSPAAMPAVYEASLALIPSPEKRAAVRAESEQYFAAGRRDKAASVIGRALGSENGFSLFYLGNFCLTALPTAGIVEAQAEFLSGFMRGYSKTGVLMLTTSSVGSFQAYPMKRGAPWRAVPAGASSAARDERIYQGKGVAFIPFDYGAKFKLDITAKDGAGVKMWKILPNGVNAKSWPGGRWEREITVRGDIKY